MKSVMLKAALFLLLCIGTLNLNAQYDVSWDYYGIGFEFAQDFSVSQNNGTVLEDQGQENQNRRAKISCFHIYPNGLFF